MGILISKLEHQQRKRIRLPMPAYHMPRFQEREVSDLVVDVLRQTAREHHVELAAYTVLPDHVHLICSAGNRGLVAFARYFKGRLAMEIKRQCRRPSPWQRSFFDHKLRSEESLQQKCLYVWLNPVRLGLSACPEDYRWSGSLLTA
jgi:REP element-mobilizing transposase RayT